MLNEQNLQSRLKLGNAGAFFWGGGGGGGGVGGS